jgi:hypothetical protein
MTRSRTRSPLRVKLLALLGPALLLMPPQAHAQDAGTAPTDESHAQPAPGTSPQDRAAIEAEIDSLRRDFNTRVQALERRLGELPPNSAAPGTEAAQGAPSVPAGQPDGAETAAVEPPAKGGLGGYLEHKEQIGRFDRDVGWVLVDEPYARLNLGLMTYARYLNQKGLQDHYTDSFGRVIPIDIRNEVQLYKVSLQFKGWLFDPKFQFLIFAWTNNANQGEPAQTVIAGFLRYKVADWLSVSAGIMPLPTTRSTNYSFPKWLRHDNRVMADEFFRGSYTSGIDVLGRIARRLEYRVMIGNNLSTLGVSSKQLDAKFDTVAASLWWMPTTGEYGAANGFGDYDYHRKLATLLAVYFTHSTETAQGQPSADSFENSQIRLTDGTLLFSPDPFGTGGKVEQARFQMASVDVGLKYKGFSLEGQWYWRRVDQLKTLGFVPISELRDDGYALQVSAMPVKDLLQVYATASKIWGANGDPTEYALGVNVYPFRRREMHVNLEGIRLNHSPVGGYHIPIPVGGNGWVFLTDWVLMF